MRVGYIGAGKCSFLVSPTRLHPINSARSNYTQVELGALLGFASGIAYVVPSPSRVRPATLVL